MPTYQQKLENLLQTSVKAARDKFMRDGHLMTTWLIEDKHDIRGMILFEPDVPKDDMVRAMRELIADRDIVRYCVEMEAWLAYGDGPLPSERPERIEVLNVFAADRQNNAASVCIEIERKGDKCFFGDVIRNQGPASGNFALFD